MPPQLSQTERTAFLAFMASDEAVRERHPLHRASPLRARHTVRFNEPHLRGSDRVERIYVSVECLLRSGLTLKEACFEVHRWWPYVPETIRRLHNDFKSRHPWRTLLPNTDLLYRRWYQLSVVHREWVWGKIGSWLMGGFPGSQFGAEYRKRDGTLVRQVYCGFTNLSHAGLLSTLRICAPAHTHTADIERFVTAFFADAKSCKQS